MIGTESNLVNNIVNIMKFVWIPSPEKKKNYVEAIEQFTIFRSKMFRVEVIRRFYSRVNLTEVTRNECLALSVLAGSQLSVLFLTLLCVKFFLVFYFLGRTLLEKLISHWDSWYLSCILPRPPLSCRLFSFLSHLPGASGRVPYRWIISKQSTTKSHRTCQVRVGQLFFDNIVAMESVKTFTTHFPKGKWQIDKNAVQTSNEPLVKHQTWLTKMCRVLQYSGKSWWAACHSQASVTYCY